MAVNISTKIALDEKSFQEQFYEAMFSEGWEETVSVDRSTDGHMDGIIFEHKQNLESYGHGKALSQAVIYLARFNCDGIPVPSLICLVDQAEQKAFFYKTEDYAEYIYDIPKVSSCKASSGISGFFAKTLVREIPFNITNAAACKNLIDYLGKVKDSPKYLKVYINEHNVYGWSRYFYQKAESKKKESFFKELRRPGKTLKEYIFPWNGREEDFALIMDLLNDPIAQKKLGAFYTPPQYAKLAAGLVKRAVSEIPEGNDYLIIDRCAGTGNLEIELPDELLEHTIVSTYELREWIALKDRLGNRVKYIIPPIREDGALPELSEQGFLSGANALERGIIDCSIDGKLLKEYIDDPHCNIILFENPPYAETTGIEFQKAKAAKASSNWKTSEAVLRMKKEITGTASNDMTNAFIWSGFHDYLKKPDDAYIIFSPIKYWKSQHIVNPTFIYGYAFNREHFHATKACVTCICWKNTEKTRNSFALEKYDIIDEALVPEGELEVKRVSKLFSNTLYENAPPDAESDGIVCALNGLEFSDDEKRIRIAKIYHPNNIAYLNVNSVSIDKPGLYQLLISGRYDGNGFYLTRDNYIEKLPAFAAAHYPEYNKDWVIPSMIMKTADGYDRYIADVKSRKIDGFLFHTLFWVALSDAAHLRSLNGSDGRKYRNELCFLQEINGRPTLAQERLNSWNYLTNTEKTLLDEWENILRQAKEKEEFVPDFTYGLYQIDQEINVTISDPSNEKKKIHKYGDLSNAIQDLKKDMKKYYIDNLKSPLFEYEFLK